MWSSNRPTQPVTAATPCTIATRPARSLMPSFGTWGKPGNWANTASISIGWATRCVDPRWSGPRSGTAATDGSRSTAPTIWCVRDCVGYRSVGHGFFLEDGTEVDNILDGNLAVQACEGKPLPGQALPFDRNEGAGFWWANSRNAFVRNVAVECDQYGFRYEAQTTAGFDGVLPVRGDRRGRGGPMDIRTLPFLRFEDNEAHAQRRYGFNLGGGPGLGAEGGVGDVGPDKQHPFRFGVCGSGSRTGLRLWPSPGVLVDGLDIAHCDFGLWRPRYERHAYRKLKMYQTAWAYLCRERQRGRNSRRIRLRSNRSMTGRRFR